MNCVDQMKIETFFPKVIKNLGVTHNSRTEEVTGVIRRTK